MHRNILISAVALALASRAVAQGIDNDDVNPNCAAVCQSVLVASDTCERQYDDLDNEDQLELDCICNADGLNTAIPECEACQRQYYRPDDDDDDDDNDGNNVDIDNDDILTLLSRCGLSTISATGTMTSMGSAPTAGSTTVITSTYTDLDDDDDDDDDLETTTITSVLPANTGATAGPTVTGAGGVASSAASSAGSAASSATGTAADAASSLASAISQSVAEQTGNFAPAMTAAPVLAVAGIAAAVFGL